MSENVPPIRTLGELEKSLSSLSHSDSAISVIRQFAAEMKDSRERLDVLNASGALVRSPILSEETKALGFTEPSDDFTFLQGDVISTESAYFLGERVINCIRQRNYRVDRSGGLAYRRAAAHAVGVSSASR